MALAWSNTLARDLAKIRLHCTLLRDKRSVIYRSRISANSMLMRSFSSNAIFLRLRRQLKNATKSTSWNDTDRSDRSTWSIATEGAVLLILKFGRLSSTATHSSPVQQGCKLKHNNFWCTELERAKTQGYGARKIHIFVFRPLDGKYKQRIKTSLYRLHQSQPSTH